jgi:hypothetical protein
VLDEDKDAMQQGQRQGNGAGHIEVEPPVKELAVEQPAQVELVSVQPVEQAANEPVQVVAEPMLALEAVQQAVVLDHDPSLEPTFDELHRDTLQSLLKDIEGLSSEDIAGKLLQTLCSYALPWPSLMYNGCRDAPQLAAHWH